MTLSLRAPIAIGPMPTGQDCLNEHVLERAEVNESCVPDDPNPDCQPIDPNHPGRWYLPPLGHGLSDLARRGPGNGAPRAPNAAAPAACAFECCLLQGYLSEPRFPSGKYTEERDVKTWQEVQRVVPDRICHCPRQFVHKR